MTEPKTAPDPPESPPSEPPVAEQKGYTAVVHFHGMGSQRRLEETARLVDALDKHQRQSTARGQPLGMLLGIVPRLDQRQDQPDSSESYIRAYWRHPTDKKAPGREIRFYEVYWAPIMAEGKSVRRTLIWLLSQCWRPLITVTTPWRERQRLRRASLMELNQSSLWTGLTPHDQDIAILAKRYNDFENLDAHAAYPHGGFSDFLAYLKTQSGVEPKDQLDAAAVVRITALARKWRARYLRTEARIFFLLTTLMLAIALAAGGVFWACAIISRTLFASGNGGIASFLPFVGSQPEVTTILFLGIAGLIGIGRFLSDALGDVEAWSTYAETDEKHRLRKAVISCGTSLIRHILADDGCGRMVITSHSLGTAVASDTLLALARANRASSEEYRMRGDPAKGGVDLERIEHLITLGSPIDKIEYFFESSRTASHRYRRVTENLRGDIGEEPFLANTKPHIHWINIWDDGDLVSGPLHSPTSAARSRNLVDNFHLKGFAFPEPASSHTRYFSHRPVIAMLFDIIIHRKLSFPAMTTAEKRAKAYGPLIVGPGSGMGERRLHHGLAIALPWVLAITLLLNLAFGVSAAPGIIVAATIATILAVAAVASIRKGPLTPL